MDPIENLKNRIFSKGNSDKPTAITNILNMCRGFSCLGEIIGRNFEVHDKLGNLVYTVVQKPIAIKQLNVFLKEYHKLQKMDAENEAKKFGGKNKSRLGRK